MKLSYDSISRLALYSLLLLCLSGLLFEHHVVAEEALPEELQPFEIKPPFAWNRTNSYQAPDFDQFFPDDVEGGKQLELMLTGKLQVTSIGHRLAVIRRGLRNCSKHRTTLLGQVGNQFIWNKNPPEPRALELLYHASDSDHHGTSHYAMYHGPTVASIRSPNLIRMLMERYQLEGNEIRGRISWGLEKYGDQEQTRKLLLALLEDYQKLDDATVGSALDTYQAVFKTEPPNMERFDEVGTWVLGYHRADLSATHPRAKDILREMLDKPLFNRKETLIDFVTRVDNGHETAVVLVKGRRSRYLIVSQLSKWKHVSIDINEMFSPRILQERRLREFARFLPDGLPENALPGYTRPPLDASYAFNANEFVAPDFFNFFPEDVEAGKQLDVLYTQRQQLEITDQQLLELVRQGLRTSKTPNAIIAWVSSALGWPGDPRTKEILYQATDTRAPVKIRKAAIYYGFGLSREKTKNMLETMARVYMAPPFDRTTNNNMRSRILWGVRDHEDDKQFLATHFATQLSDPEKLLSVSFFRDEEALNEWRRLTAHRKAQQIGRTSYFKDYRLRVAHVLRDYGMDDREAAPSDSLAVHG